MFNSAVASLKGSGDAIAIESVADILDRELYAVIQDWLSRVEKEPDLTCIPLSFEPQGSPKTGHIGSAENRP
jgi:hypothetical protein